MRTAKIRYRLLAAAAAVTAALGILSGGTFAWQSISQTALNEASDVVNPGGRLHDDFDGKNKDIYVENFAEEPIYARIRLTEYFEIGREAGFHLGEENRTGFEVITDGAIYRNTDSYNIHYFDRENLTSPYWTWRTGGSTVYMPTFNKNKDSLQADINGTLEGLDGEVTAAITDDRYSDYIPYALDDTAVGTEVYDIDTNAQDEGDEAIDQVNTIVVENVTHTAKSTGTAKLISMDEWMNDYNSEPGEYWVYDTDGWVYWAQAIPGCNEDGTTNATGLLLDGIELKQVMDDSWFYAIHVTAQFVTADDVGKTDGTGFYSDVAQKPSDNAEALLRAIGVELD